MSVRAPGRTPLVLGVVAAVIFATIVGIAALFLFSLRDRDGVQLAGEQVARVPGRRPRATATS